MKKVFNNMLRNKQQRNPLLSCYCIPNGAESILEFRAYTSGILRDVHYLKNFLINFNLYKITSLLLCLFFTFFNSYEFNFWLCEFACKVMLYILWIMPPLYIINCYFLYSLLSFLYEIDNIKLSCFYEIYILATAV